jgi:hypothetical protein
MSWDTGASNSWNDGGAATTLNEPAAGGGGWNGGADSFNDPALAGGDNRYGAGEAYGGDGEGGNAFSSGEGGHRSGGCFNCGEEG